MTPNLDRCPSTLELGYERFSPAARKVMFGSKTKKVSHILPISSPGSDPKQAKTLLEKRTHISISGVQEKYSVRLKKGLLDIVDQKGQYILKPAPGGLAYSDQVPANEHLTMQVASQVYGLNTAACSIVFFSDGAQAYITKRFDYKPDGNKYQVEDFATLLGKTEERNGDEYKYNASYEDIAEMIARYVPAYKIEMQRFFKLVLFNFLSSNGDAHLKNFSVIESKDGDYILAPAYDLMNTRIHINDLGVGLTDGLFKGALKDDKTGCEQYTYKHFLEFGKRITLPERLVIKTIDAMIDDTFMPMARLAERSFLSDDIREDYIRMFHGKLHQLKDSK